MSSFLQLLAGVRHSQFRYFVASTMKDEGMTLEYPRKDMFLGFQGHRLWLGLRQQQYGVGLNSLSAF